MLPPALASTELPASPAQAGLRPLDTQREQRAGRRVILATAATVVALFVLLLESIVRSNHLRALDDDSALEIEVTGKQWFWQVRYLDAASARVFTTANEIHLPAGHNVRLRLASAAVIHSFWAPNLHGSPAS